ncbi:Replication protein A C terminal [Desulfocicer vacuolatum DSM 3385]|uniref:Replication protein A C terminal n=1 Tax=Desulfocicer vacuolatum DSM 3385 TaxID=1121400 RepID=A0A1W1YKL2_9BACT|nr:hypothetical protein [Desulfocicer vacuolatum]SMC36735.1 Replication protein A C terminal [Desulfocicer vacuolatum DSM 3385]
MKIEIKIDADKDSMEKIQKQLKSISVGISNVIKIFEQVAVNLDSEKNQAPVPPEAEKNDGIKDETPDTVTEKIIPAKETAEKASGSAPVPDVQDAAVKEDAGAVKSPEASAVPEKKSTPAAKKSVKKTTKKSKAASTSRPSKAKKKTAARKPRITAATTVLNHIKKSKTGLDSKTLEKKTGFSAKKVADAVYKLKKSGLIEKTDQALFVLI